LSWAIFNSSLRDDDATQSNEAEKTSLHRKQKYSCACPGYFEMCAGAADPGAGEDARTTAGLETGATRKAAVFILGCEPEDHGRLFWLRLGWFGGRDAWRGIGNLGDVDGGLDLGNSAVVDLHFEGLAEDEDALDGFAARGDH